MSEALTGAQIRFLDLAERAPRNGWDGVLAKGTRLRMAEALGRRGLLRFVGCGVDADGDGDGREWPIYELTDAGRAALAKARGER
jgi:hypothetical protein